MAKLSKTEAAIEAILFALGTSVEIRQLCAALDMKESEVIQNLESLKTKYEKDNRGIQIIDLGDCVQMCTKTEYYEQLIRVCKTPKKQVLTDALLETLSIIAYKQPITKAEIEEVRGVNSDKIIKQLLTRSLIAELGHKDTVGRPILYGTTDEFLRSAGVESIEALHQEVSETEG